MSFSNTCTVQDFCKRYHIHFTTFYRRRTDLPRTIKVGGQLRITASDEAAWLARKQAEADSGGAR